MFMLTFLSKTTTFLIAVESLAISYLIKLLIVFMQSFS